MSCAEALRRCPHATFVRPRHSLYRDYSREVWSTVREIVPTVEQAGIDEGYLDLEEVAPAFDDARAVAESVRAVVRARTRLSCSLGVATSKVVAKVASDRRKPGGLTVVRPGREAAFLAPFPIRLLPGVGPRAEERLAAAGIDTIGGLAALGDDELRTVAARRRRPPAARSRPRPRPAPARGLDRAHLDLERGDLRAGHRRPRAPARRAAAAGVAPRRAPPRPGPGRAHGDDEAALPRLRDPDALDVAADRHRRRRAHRRARVQPARPRPARPPRAAAARRRRRLRARRRPATFAARRTSDRSQSVFTEFTLPKHAHLRPPSYSE